MSAAPVGHCVDLSTSEKLVLCALSCVDTDLAEIRGSCPDILTTAVMQRLVVAELVHLTGLETPEVLAALRALERKGMVVSEKLLAVSS